MWTLTLFAAAALAADRPALAIVEKVWGQVGLYTASGERLAGVKIGQYPHEIVMSPDKKLLYISDNGILWMTEAGEGGNTISIVDIEKRERVGVISLGENRRPHGMALDPATGRILVTTENPDGLLLVDPVARKVVRRYDVKGGAPHMVLFGPRSAWAYVSNTKTNTIAAVQIASGAVKVIPTDPWPQGGALSPDGKRIYLTNRDGDSISILDTAEHARIGTIKVGKGPARVAITPDGKRLVYNLGNANAVAFADIATRKELVSVPIGGQPLSLTLSNDGKLAYAGIQDQDKVAVISVAERRLLRMFATPKGSGPDPVLPID